MTWTDDHCEDGLRHRFDVYRTEDDYRTDEWRRPPDLAADIRRELSRIRAANVT